MKKPSPNPPSNRAQLHTSPTASPTASPAPATSAKPAMPTAAARSTSPSLEKRPHRHRRRPWPRRGRRGNTHPARAISLPFDVRRSTFDVRILRFPWSSPLTSRAARTVSQPRQCLLEVGTGPGDAGGFVLCLVGVFRFHSTRQHEHLHPPCDPPLSGAAKRLRSTRRGTATPTSRSVLSITRNMNLHPALNARPR